MQVAQLIRSRVLWVGLALLVAYWPLAWFFPFFVIIEVMNGVLVALSLAVMIAYLPGVIDAIRSGRPDFSGQLILGIGCAWLSTCLTYIWLTVWRASGQPLWMANHDLRGWFVWVGILAAILHMTAPDAINGRVPPKGWIWLGVAMGAGALGAMAIIFWSWSRLP